MLRVSIIAAITLAATSSSALANDQSAAALFARGDFSAAAAAYDTALRAHPDDRTAQLDLGAIYLYQNDLAAAEPLLDSVLAADAKNPRASQLLAEVMRRRAEAARRTTLDGAQSRVPFVAANPLPVVQVVVNGISANFLVDTGGDVDLETSFVKRLGIKPENAGSGVFAGGLRAPVQRAMLESLALGGATAYDVPVHVLATHASAFFSNLRVDGVLGTTFFERFLVTIDYPRNELIVRPRSPEVSKAFQAQAAASGAAILPCYLVGDHFVLARAQVGDAPPGLFLFDTGLVGGGLMASPQLVSAAQIHLDQARAGEGYGGGGMVTAVPFIAQRVAVGTAVQQNVAGSYTPQGNPFGIFPFSVWGAISSDFLRHYAYTVDFDAMRIVLAPSTPD
jgi:hypothetical protein